MSPTARGFLHRWDVQFTAVLCLMAIFSVVAWQSVQSVNTLWDEQQDYPVAVALVQDPLRGTGGNGSQARLPMYAVAGAFALIGESLAVARVVSIVMGASAIVITWVAGRRWFGDATGLLAVALLAMAPYFIGFSRTALTEGDAFCPLTVLLVLVAFDTYLRRCDSWGVLLLSASLGVAMRPNSSRWSWSRRCCCAMSCTHVQRNVARPSALDGHMRRGSPGSSLPPAPNSWPSERRRPRYVPLSMALWAIGGGVMLLASYWLMSRAEVRWPAWVAWPAILLLALTICLAAFPEHVIQPAMVGDFLTRSYDWDGSRPSAALIDNARLYSGIILLKLGVPLGLLGVAALLWACVRSLHNGPLRWIVLVVAVYLIVLLLLPLRQTFYLMSVYPLLVLLLAGFLVQIMSMLHRRPLVRGVWLSVVTASHLWLLWGAVCIYPQFGWYGYETIGDHWLGEESRGYRNVIQVTNDGTEDALRWLVAHVPAEPRVVSYLSDYHVVDAFARRHSIPFILIQEGGNDGGQQPRRLQDPNYLVVSLHNLMDGDVPLIRPDETSTALVHTIWRGRGWYRLPMVQIYRVGGHR